MECQTHQCPIGGPTSYVSDHAVDELLGQSMGNTRSATDRTIGNSCDRRVFYLSTCSSNMARSWLCMRMVDVLGNCLDISGCLQIVCTSRCSNLGGRVVWSYHCADPSPADLGGEGKNSALLLVEAKRTCHT